MGYKGAVRVFEINRDGGARKSRSLRAHLLDLGYALTRCSALTLVYLHTETDEPLFTVTASGSKATVAAWCALDQYIVTGHENGTLNLWDMVSATGCS